MLEATPENEPLYHVQGGKAVRFASNICLAVEYNISNTPTFVNYHKLAN